MQDRKMIKPVSMGQYIVVERKKSDANLMIATPTVQSCIAVVLVSDHAVGLGHFDSIYDLENTLHNMIKEMKTFGNSKIRAELIGGLYGITPQTTWLLSDTISSTLNKDKISFEHKHYSSYYTGISTTSLYLISNLLGIVGPESMLYSVPLSIMLFVGVNYAESWMRTDYHDVMVHVKTGDITAVKNNPQKSKEIIQEFSTYQSGFFNRRMTHDVFDKNLKYEKIMPEPSSSQKLKIL